MLSEKELATILAALRFFQANFNDTVEMREEMPLHFESVLPLNHQEIDELCEQLNTEDYLVISHLPDLHRESDHSNNEKIEQIADQVVNIATLSKPQMKYLLVEINERNGEKEYTARCLAQCSSKQNPKLVADAIALNWYEDHLEEDPLDRDSFWWFEGGAIAVEVEEVKELSQQHYDLLSLYLSDLTPVDTEVNRAIAYKSAALSYQGESKNV